MANIGKGCIINTGAVIEHETYIGNYAHIAPGSVLAGNVTIGDSSFIGANTVVREGIMIGNNAVSEHTDTAEVFVIPEVADKLFALEFPEHELPVHDPG